MPHAEKIAVLLDAEQAHPGFVDVSTDHSQSVRNAVCVRAALGADPDVLSLPIETLDITLTKAHPANIKSSARFSFWPFALE